MKGKIHRKCPVCGNSKEMDIIKNISFKIPMEYGLPNSFNIISCDDCGFCYADTPADEGAYSNYYTNYNVYSFDEGLVKTEEDQIIDEQMSNFLTLDSKILNIGVGSGKFEKRALRNGYKDIVGIDPSSDSIEILKKNGIEGFVGNIYDEPNKEYIGKFDAVFLQATLEHLLFPMEAIKNIIKYISVEGKIFITVPDCGKIDENETRIPNNFNQEHINYFSRQSMINLFNQLGFREAFYKGYSIDKNSVIFQIFECDKNNVSESKKDSNTCKAIRKYLDTENRRNKNIIRGFENYKKTREELVIWGTGAYTMNLLANTCLDECNIVYYIDNNPTKEGRIYNGKNIKLPSKQLIENKTILVCSMLHSESIKKQITSMNVKCKIEVI